MKNCQKTIDHLAAMTMGRTCACFHMRKGARAITMLFNSHLRPIGLRATQLTLLAALRLLEPTTIKQLAEATVMDRTTATRNLKPLTQRGLIESGSGEDQRTRRLILTERGRAVLSEAFPLWQKAQEQVVNGLGAQRLNSLLEGISMLIKLK